MMWIISHQRPDLAEDQEPITFYKGIYSFGINIVPYPNGFDPCPHLDEELRDLLVAALNTNPARRPTIREIWFRVENGMKKTPEEYPFRQYEESDSQIDARLQSLIHDA